MFELFLKNLRGPLVKFLLSFVSGFFFVIFTSLVSALFDGEFLRTFRFLFLVGLSATILIAVIRTIKEVKNK